MHEVPDTPGHAEGQSRLMSILSSFAKFDSPGIGSSNGSLPTRLRVHACIGKTTPVSQGHS